LVVPRSMPITLLILTNLLVSMSLGLMAGGHWGPGPADTGIIGPY